MRKYLVLVGFAALVALGSGEALTETAGITGGGDRWRFRLKLVAPEPNIRIQTGRGASGPVISIPTFEAAETRGRTAMGPAPLPVKVVRVAIPEGGRVSLEIIQAPGRLLEGLRPRSNPTVNVGPSLVDAEPTAAQARGEPHQQAAARAAGRAPVRLGQVGYFREQRFAEVVYTPVVRAPASPANGPAAPGFLFYPDVSADVIVESTSRGAAVRSGPGYRPDPFFEEAYETAFINYDRNRSLRGGPGGAPVVAGLSGAAAATAPPVGSRLFGSAATPVYRLIVREDGIYRLTYSYLLDPVTGVAPGLAGVDPATFKLMNKGVEVPIRVVTAVAGTFAPGDFIEFFGEGLLDEPDLLLNFDFDTLGQPLQPDIFQANDFTDENVYFLFGESGARSRIPDLPAPVTAGPPVAASFADTIHREFDTKFVPNGTDDPFFQNPFLPDDGGTFNADPNLPDCGHANTGVTAFTDFLGPMFPAGDPHNCQACDLNLPDPLAVPDLATIRVRMRGASADPAVNPDHMTVVQLGATASRSSTMCWDGEAVVVQSLTVPQTALSGGDGVFIGQPGLAATASREFLILDWIEVDYLRALRLDAGGLEAHFPDADRTYQVGGFTTSATADMVVYDTSRRVGTSAVPSPQHVVSGAVGGTAGDFSLTFTLAQDASLGTGAVRTLAAADPGGFKLPVRAEAVIGQDLRATTNEADMLVVTTPQVIGEPPTPAFSAYVAHRAADSNLTVKVVMIQDVYDNFSDGIETPEALRSFLLYAFNNWKGPSGTAAPPAYVMLVGDTSLDYKNNIKDADWINEIPTFMMYRANLVLDYYASDTHIAAFRGSDEVPDIHLGRVSVRTPAEAEVTFQKMLDYDTNPPPTDWRVHGLFLADRGKTPAETADFESTQTSLADTYFAAPRTNEKLFYSDPNFGAGIDPIIWRDAYVQRADAGAALTHYFGHGSFADWGLDGLMISADVALLSPTQKPTFLVNENCLVGGFHALGGDALGEALEKAGGKGAIAVFAPAGLTFASVTQIINPRLYNPMFDLTKERRFGNLMTNIKLGFGGLITDLQAYTLLGDPAQRFTLPAPRPPVGFSATTGLDAQVALSWSPGPDPGGLTRIYRTEFPFAGGTYTLLTPSGVAGTSFTDTNVVNGTAYFYRAVSLDPNGIFEGAPTNFNSDCQLPDPSASGPDCVWAVPSNPNPPAPPANFAVGDPGNGDRLTVSWDAPLEPDILKHTVQYGTTDGGPYPSSVDFPAGTDSGEITGLTLGTTYFMVATATNTSIRTSLPSPQRAGRPAQFEGIDPPEIIGDLRVNRSASAPDSIELTWTPPATDIYGGPTTVSSFAIYRDLFPAFVPSAANLLTTINSGTTTTYVDAGAFSAPGNFYYLVGTKDARGFSSGVGRQLPQGVTDLTVALNGTNLEFSWSPVTTDMDGLATLVSHYVLYADTLPAGRSRIDGLTPLVPSVSTDPLSIPLPPDALVYYNLITVDVRGNQSPF